MMSTLGLSTTSTSKGTCSRQLQPIRVLPGLCFQAVRPAGGVPGRAVCPSAQVVARPRKAVRVRVAAEEEEATGADYEYESLHLESYVCLGLAQCFQKGTGTLTPVTIIEPLSASSLECLANGARTSYKMVTGVALGDAYHRNRTVLPEAFRDSPFCDNYDFRLEAAARTWIRPHAQDNLMDIVPFGKVRSNFNFSLEDKRVLNMENVVNDNDNIKQDLSIDVYGRKKADEYAEKTKGGAACEHEAAQQQDKAAKRAQLDQDLDSLLMA